MGMKTSRKTAGVTLVVTVLIVMLLLAGVVVVTGQLALSARRSGIDQEATIRAQYVAESGIARAQAKLGQARQLMLTASFPQTINFVDLRTQFANFCNITNSLLVLDPATTPGTMAAPTTLCTVATGSTNTSGSMIAGLIKASYSDFAGWSADTWTQLFSTSGSVVSGTAGTLNISGNLKIKAVSVIKQGLDDYLLNMQVLNVESTGSNGDSSRSLKGDSNGVFTLRVYRPPFSTFAQFRNLTTAVSTTSAPGNDLFFATGESFRGPVHTNDTLKIGATFYDELSTAKEATSGSGIPNIMFGGSPSNCQPLSSIVAGGCPTLYPNGAISYPKYVPRIELPTNNSSQVRASLGLDQAFDSNNLPATINDGDQAAALGLTTLPIPNGVYYSKASTPNSLMGGLYVQGDANVSLSTTSGSPRLQVIQITQGGQITEFRQAASGSWSVKKPDGSVTNLSGKFNGVLYVKGNVNMSGDGTDAPDIASSTALTVSNSGGDILLKSSITYNDCPLTTGCPPQSTSAPAGTNVLGFFSDGGSVKLDGPTTGDMYINASVLASATGKGFGSVRSPANGGTSARKIHLIGGVIENQSQTVSSGGDGYSRDYNYDPRFKLGLTPPYFPLQQRWAAVPNAKFDIGTVRQKQ